MNPRSTTRTPPHECDCGKALMEPHRDGCAELRSTYLRCARSMVRRLVPILRERPGGDALRQAAEVLDTVKTPFRHPTRVTQAGQLLQTDSDDVHAVYLGARLQAIGEHLAQRQAPTRADMQLLWQVWHLKHGLEFGTIPNDPGHLIPTSERLDRLHTATAAARDVHPMVSDQTLSHGQATLVEIRELLSGMTNAPIQPSTLLCRTEQDRFDWIVNGLVPVAGKDCTIVYIGPDAVQCDLETISFSPGDIPVAELVAAALLLRLEASAWPPTALHQALTLLHHAEQALRPTPASTSTAPPRPGWPASSPTSNHEREYWSDPDQHHV